MLGKQAKILTPAQIRSTERHLEATRHPTRNLVIFALSVKAGLRAKEIAGLRWSMVTNSDGSLADTIRLVDAAAKGSSGGVIPLAIDLRKKLNALRLSTASPFLASAQVVRSSRQEAFSAQAIVNLFAGWYRDLGFEGCSSHSGRRTFITMAARNIGRFGGSLRDVQALARHSSLTMTQRYIEVDTEAMRKVVDA